MKTLLSLLFMVVSMLAQPGPFNPITYVTTAPTGSCRVGIAPGYYVVVSTLATWACEGPIIGGPGTWTQQNAGGSGGAPGGVDTNVQVNHPLGTFAGNVDFSWHETITTNGMTGLQLGLLEPLLNCCDGASNSTSIVANHNIQQNVVQAGGFGILTSFYLSGGTVTSPANVTGGLQQLIQGTDFYAFTGGSWNNIAFIDADFNSSTNAGILDFNIGSGSGPFTPIGDVVVMSSDGTHLQLQLTQNGVNFAGPSFTEISSSELELDNGTIGTLAQFDLGTLNQPGVAFASLPGSPSNGMQIFCTDCQVTTVTANVVSNSTCKASGTGATALRVNGAWKCNYLP